MVKRIYLVIITAFLLFPVSVSASESSAVISEDTLTSQANGSVFDGSADAEKDLCEKGRGKNVSGIYDKDDGTAASVRTN